MSKSDNQTTICRVCQGRDPNCWTCGGSGRVSQTTDLDKFLDTLPMRASVVSGSERMREKSDAELQAWAWGVEDTVNAIRELIAEWRSAHD